MTTQEFSNTFDTLLNSYASKAMFGDQSSQQEIVLDEYEKSVLLTQAQDIIVKQYFEKNNVDLGFDESERRQVDFSNIIGVASAVIDTSSTEGSFGDGWMVDTPVATGTHILFVLNEKLVFTKSTTDGQGNTTTVTKSYVIVPINYHEYDRQMSKPFSQPLKKQAWRLIQQDTATSSTTKEGTTVEIVPTDAARALIGESYAAAYKIRYVRRPTPIILTDLAGAGLSVDGITAVTECELNPIIHMDILNKAVELAYTTRTGTAVAAREQQPRQR